MAREPLQCCLRGTHSFSWRQGIEDCRHCGAKPFHNNLADAVKATGVLQDILDVFLEGENRSVTLGEIKEALAKHRLKVVGEETYAALRARLEAFEQLSPNHGESDPYYPPHAGFFPPKCSVMRFESGATLTLRPDDGQPYRGALTRAPRAVADEWLHGSWDVAPPEPEDDYEALGYPETEAGTESTLGRVTLMDLVETLHACVDSATKLAPIKKNDDDTDKD